MSWVSLCNFIVDLILTLIYFRRLDNAGRRVLPTLGSYLCLLGTLVLYTTGLIPVLSGSIQRFLLRGILLFFFVCLSRPVQPLTALYAVIYWCTLQTLVQSLFFAPFSYPLFIGSATFTGIHALDTILCILLSILIKCCCFLPFYLFTPFAGMSPIYRIDLIPGILVAAVDIYVREIAVPMTGISRPDTTEISNYYILLQVVLLVLLGFIEYNRKYRAGRAIDQIKKQETEALLKNIQNNRENARAASALRHDFKNHLLSLRLLTQEGNTEEVYQYIDAILKKAAPVHRQYHTGNDLADGLLSIKLDPAATKDLDVQVTLDLTAGSFLSNEDLCVLLGNVLDNALEACRQMDPLAHPYIRIQGGVSANYLLLRFENSCRKMPMLIEGLPLTGKADAQFHGYGLRNVRSVLDKYQGTLSISQGSPQQFILSMMIPLPDRSSAPHSS